MKSKELTISVALTRFSDAVTTINLDGSQRRDYHLHGEADSAAVCMALREASGRVARGEVVPADTFSVVVKLVRKGELR